MSRTRTFLDSGVLIAAARSTGSDQQIALSILRDPNRIFLATPFLALEVVPKAAFKRQHLELLFYKRYMTSATTYRGLNRIESVARTEAARCGLAAMDALHVAAAFLLDIHLQAFYYDRVEVIVPHEQRRKHSGSKTRFKGALRDPALSC